MRKLVYPDTNIALHYRPFEEIDWRRLVNADEVNLVITSVFLRELDRYKDQGRGVIQKRARRVSGWLGTLRKTGAWDIAEKVRVTVVPTEPELAVSFPDYGLVASVNDDRIIACILRDRTAHPGVEQVCVTADNTLSFKADDHGIVCVEPPPDARLADEPDAAELENRELRKELLEMKRRVAPTPDLDIRFAPDAATLLTAKVSILEPVGDDTIAGKRVEAGDIAEMRSRIKPVLNQPDRSVIRAYTQSLGEWMHRYNTFAVERGLTFVVQFQLENGGQGNAENIDIDLSFPDHLFVAERRALRNPGPRPSAPQTSFDALRNIDPYGSESGKGLDDPRAHTDRWFSSQRDLMKLVIGNDPHRLGIHVASLKHSSTLILPPFDGWFASGAGVPNGFAIEYRIHTASTPEVKAGKLHVKLDVERGSVTFPEA